jgi:hypothetical protein
LTYFADTSKAALRLPRRLAAFQLRFVMLQQDQFFTQSGTATSSPWQRHAEAIRERTLVNAQHRRVSSHGGREQLRAML